MFHWCDEQLRGIGGCRASSLAANASHFGPLKFDNLSNVVGMTLHISPFGAETIIE